MTSRPLTPNEFSKLKSPQEKDQAYSHLWDVWQSKKARKNELFTQVTNAHSQHQSGANKTNARARKAANYIIKQYWERRHCRLKVTADVLYKLLKNNKEYEALKLTTVKRWNTAIRNTWKTKDWFEDPKEYKLFKKEVWENYRLLIQ